MEVKMAVGLRSVANLVMHKLCTPNLRRRLICHSEEQLCFVSMFQRNTRGFGKIDEL